MIERIANIGVSNHLNIRQRRVVQLINLMSVALALAVSIPIVFNFKAGETTNALVLIALALTYLSNLFWHRVGNRTVPKLILGFVVTFVPYINLIAIGRIPDGQFISMLPSTVASFCCFLIIADQREDQWIYYTGIAYYILLVPFMDLIVIEFSTVKPDIEFMIIHYSYYKIPYVICLILMPFVFYFFKSTFYKYEQESERNQQALESKNIELFSLNNSLESKVKERTSALAISNQRLIELAYITAHEVRGPLSSILSVTNYHLANKQDQSLMEIFPLLHERAVVMDKVIKKMLKTIEAQESGISTVESQHADAK